MNPEHKGGFPKPGKRKKKKRKYIRKIGDNRKAYADELWSKLIKHKAGWKCEYCQSSITKGLSAHHLGLKKNYRMRYSIINGMALCSKHHLYTAHTKQPQEQIKWYEWVKSVRGEDIWDRLDLMRKNPSKSDLTLVIIFLKKELLRYERV